MTVTGWGLGGVNSHADILIMNVQHILIMNVQHRVKSASGHDMGGETIIY